MIKVSIDRITPNPLNPRKKFDQAALEELAASIREVGILQALVVVEEDPYAQEPSFRIIAGERRWRAAKLAGLAEVPVTVADITPEQEAQVMLIENLQREDLDPIDEARAFASLTQEHGWKQTELAEKLGCSQAHIANRIRLLKLPAQLQENISAGIMPHSVGKELVTFAQLPTVMKDIVKKVEDANKQKQTIGISIIDHAKRQAWNSTKPLHHGGYPDPIFDLKSCEQCNERIFLSEPWGKDNKFPRCLNDKCWEQKQAAAEAEKKEARRQKLAKGAADAVIDISKLDYGNYHYLERAKFDTMECEHCENVKLGAYRPDASDREPEKICINTACFGKKTSTAEKEERRREKLRREALDAWKEEQFNQETVSREALAYTAAQAVENCPYSGTMDRRSLLKAVYARYGWNADHLKETWYQDRTKELVTNILTLPDAELMKLIFFAMLKPVGQDNTVFKAVFGDVLAEKRENEAAS
ncbi:MAG: ParB/RepB/Spo0J family partition protein [bacterium]|jgi:ParB/RepB/Spo0J family partition protein